MNAEQMRDSDGHSGRTTAMSVYDDQANGMNDFPVLKAFQEYIDAEQARARKRMLGLSIFFVTLLVVVVVTFSVIMAAVINRDQQNLSMIATRNQELSDKLLDIALRERIPAAQSAPVVNVQQPAQPIISPQSPADSATAALMKPVLARLEELAATLHTPQPQPEPVQITRPPIPRQTQTADVQKDEAAALREELRQQRESVAVERAKLKAEREKLRQEQIEQHRRRLYPDYYARQDARAKVEDPTRRGQHMPDPLPQPMVKPRPSQPQTRDSSTATVSTEATAQATLTKEAISSTNRDSKLAQPAAGAVSEKTVLDKRQVLAATPVDLKTTKPINYFAQDDDDIAPSKIVPKQKPAEVSSQAKAPSTNIAAPKTETIKVGASEDNQIPWLIELP